MKVLVTRAAFQAESMVAPLREMGLEPILLPCIEILEPGDWSEVDQALASLDLFDWIVWTSANGVRATFDRLRTLRLSTARPTGPRVASVGPSTTAELLQNGWTADFTPDEYVSERLGTEMDVSAGERVLLLRGNRATFDLPRILRAKGAEVAEAIVYRTADIPAQRLAGQLHELTHTGLPEAITLVSPSAARSLFLGAELAGLRDWVLGARVYCLGPVTGDALRDLGKSVLEMPEEHTVRGLLDLIAAKEAVHGR